MNPLATVPDEILTTICQQMVEEPQHSLKSFSSTSTHHREIAMEVARSEVRKELKGRNLGTSYESDSKKIVIKGLPSLSFLKGDVSMDIHRGHMSTEMKIVVTQGSRTLTYTCCNDNLRHNDGEILFSGDRVEFRWNDTTIELTVNGCRQEERNFQVDRLRIERWEIKFPFFTGNTEGVRVANEELAIIRKAIEEF